MLTLRNQCGHTLHYFAQDVTSYSIRPVLFRPGVRSHNTLEYHCLFSGLEYSPMHQIRTNISQ